MGRERGKEWKHVRVIKSGKNNQLIDSDSKLQPWKRWCLFMQTQG